MWPPQVFISISHKHLEFYDEKSGLYNMHYKNKDLAEPGLSGESLVEYYINLLSKYPSKLDGQILLVKCSHFY